ncbi:putative cyclase [Scleroderma citrinum]
MSPTSIIDLSHPLQDPMTCYPGDPGFKKRSACNFPISSSPCMVVVTHELTLSTHTGTHVDAPFHFFPDGARLSEIPFEQFVGRAVVLDVRHAARAWGCIDWADVDIACNTTSLAQIGARSSGKVDIVLLWTGWDVHWDTPTYYAHPYFSRGVAESLRNLGAQVVGVDMLGPDGTPEAEAAGQVTSDSFAVHEVLLGSGRIICENLRGIGSLVGDDEAWISMVPLNVQGADASPVRAYGWRQRRNAELLTAPPV